MALNVATLALILCRQVKTIKHGSVRVNIVHVHFPIPCFLNFCSAIPTLNKGVELPEMHNTGLRIVSIFPLRKIIERSRINQYCTFFLL